MGANPDNKYLKQYSLAANQSSRSRKRSGDQPDQPIHVSSDGEGTSSQVKISSKRRRTIDSEEPPEEKRLKRFRPKCPNAVLERIYRVRSQKMFILNRARDDSQGFPTEVFDVAGTTGNIYQVDICQIPTCTCPDSGKHGTCKHILYVLIKALKAPNDLRYQAALLTSELQQIFDNAPPPSDGKTDDKAGKRKSLREDDCPICYEGFEQGDNNTVFCRAQCGTNLHKECFRQWASQARANSKPVTCVMCRSNWEESEDIDTGHVLSEAKVGEDGYLNVGEALGMPTVRDTSSYHMLGMYRKYGGGYGGSYGFAPRRRRY